MSRVRRLGLAGLTLLVLCSLGLWFVPPGGDRADAATGSAVTKHKQLTRFWGTGSDQLSIDTRDVSVTVGKTKSISGRQRVHISWSGAHPTGGRAPNPLGPDGLDQEYPVVIMLCRGVDGSTKTPLSPSTCWTSSVDQRTISQGTGGVTGSESPATWLDDQFATPADRKLVVGDIAKCGLSTDQTAIHVTPFVSASGKIYKACNSDNMPPEATVGSSLPAAEVAAFTDTDGKGSFEFEVRTKDENASLGCSNTVPCSIVVIPIMGISCAVASSNCQAGPVYAEGSSADSRAATQALTPRLWWSASNWRGRFSFPITIAPDRPVCTFGSGGVPVSFYGSELLFQASLQWAPAYCLNSKRFGYAPVSMSDSIAFSQMLTGAAAAATVTGPHDAGTTPVAYAPTAATGFAIGYVIDRPHNAGEYTSLRLNARLIAKLLTESYPASSVGAKHPGLGSNPWTLVKDPEFQKLNPGLSSLLPGESQATLEALSIDSDITKSLTSYIATDKDAMAFIDGNPDPWGMKVNPYYKGIKLPVSTWPLLDEYVVKSINACPASSPYLQLVAAPVSTISTITQDLIDAWPRQQVNCSGSGSWATLARVPQQGLGGRFLIGITDMGDAARYGIRTAALQTKGTRYVGPSSESIRAALKLAKRSNGLQPFTLSQESIRAAGNAYPGASVIYTATRTKGLDAATAKRVAQFITVSTTEGQQAGIGNGQLAEGYVPISKSGVTGPLYSQAQSVAALVAAQKGNPGNSGGGGESSSPTTSAPTATSAPQTSGSPTSPLSSGSSTVNSTPTASAATPTATSPPKSKDTNASAPKTTTVATSPTKSPTSQWGELLLPTLLFVAVMAGGSAALLRLLAREKVGS